MGSRWKMFTKTQGQELIDGTYSTWTTINGKNGRKFISKTDPSKYIFLPAGGLWFSTDNNDVGLYGYYWSAMWYSSSLAWNMNFYSSLVHWNYNYYRRYGFPIRGVM